MKSITLALISLSFFSRCGDKKGDDAVSHEAPESAFLTPSEPMAEKKLNQFTAEEVHEEIASHSDLLEDDTADSGAGFDTGKERDCFTSLFSGLKLTVKGDTVKAAGNLDLSECLRESVENDAFSAMSGRLILFFSLTCEGEDLSRLDGKTFLEAAVPGMGEDSCSAAMKVNALTNIRVSLNFAGQVEGRNFSQGVVIDSSTSTPLGDACRSENSGSGFITDNCLSLVRTKANPMIIDGVPKEETSSESYIAFTSRNLVSAPDRNTWYESGTMDVEVNNWSGNVSYTGVAVDPTYVLSNGTRTVSGYVRASGSSLTTQPTETFMAMFNLPKLRL